MELTKEERLAAIKAIHDEDCAEKRALQVDAALERLTTRVYNMGALEEDAKLMASEVLRLRTQTPLMAEREALEKWFEENPAWNDDFSTPQRGASDLLSSGILKPVPTKEQLMQAQCSKQQTTCACAKDGQWHKCVERGAVADAILSLFNTQKGAR